jgi:hypothetical protein
MGGKIVRTIGIVRSRFKVGMMNLSSNIRQLVQLDSNPGAPRCTTKLENAHSTEFRELLYPWHPWSGLRTGIHEAIERSGLSFAAT